MLTKVMEGIGFSLIDLLMVSVLWAFDGHPIVIVAFILWQLFLSAVMSMPWYSAYLAAVAVVENRPMGHMMTTAQIIVIGGIASLLHFGVHPVFACAPILYGISLQRVKGRLRACLNQ